MIRYDENMKEANLSFNLLSANPAKLSNTVKQFVDNNWRIILVCLSIFGVATYLRVKISNDLASIITETPSFIGPKI